VRSRFCFLFGGFTAMEYLVLFTLVATALAASNCSIKPIYVDFHDRCVDDCFTIQYGLFIGVGDPFQNESLWPSISRNEITFSGVDFCADGSSEQCVNQTHGLYSPGTSLAFQERQNYVALDNNDALTQGLATIDAVGTETMNIFTHYFDPSPPNVTRLTEVPIHVLSNYSSPNSPWFGPSGLLGLGQDSTVLTRLHDSDLISSRSFGLFVGTAYPRAGGAINGSLTLGGYDSGRFTDDAVEYELAAPAANSNDPTPYRVQVASVSLTNGNNETTVLSQGQFDAYLTTSQYEVTLPSDITSTFASLTSAAPAGDELASLISPNLPAPLTIPSDFSGALTITLTSGLNIIFDTTSGSLRNTSNLSPISSSPSADTPVIPLLGTSALAHLYLTTNYDSTPPKFYLNPSAPHGPYVITQPLCANDVPEAYTSPRISSFQRNGTIGAILGGVIGGIGLTFAVWWAIRKYFQHREHKRWESMYGDGDGGKGKRRIGEERKEDYDVDEEGLKYLAGYRSRKRNSGSTSEDMEMGEVRKHRKFGILKKNNKPLDRSRNPISAFRAEMNDISHDNEDSLAAISAQPQGSGSSSSNTPPHQPQEEDSDYDMSSFAYALPPGAGLHTPQSQTQPQTWPLPPRSRARSPTNPSTEISRAPSPDPLFTPLDSHVSYGQATQQSVQPVQFPRRVPVGPHRDFSDVPLSPQQTQTQAGLRVPTHHRSQSQESLTRREMGLTVNTYFEGPPGTRDRVGKKLKGGRKKGIFGS
jgi:hypothetical protein